MKNQSNAAERALAAMYHSSIGMFEEIYYEKLCLFLSDVSQDLEKLGSLIPNLDDVLFDIGFSAEKQLIQLGIRTILTLLYEKQEELVGDTPESRYTFFVEKYISGQFDQIFPVGSEARWLIENRLSLTRRALSEFCDRILRDRNEIKNKLGIQIDSIQSLSLSLGDTHGNGRSVFVLKINDGEKLVYKPHSLYNDIVWGKVLGWLTERDGLKTDMRHISVLDRGDYGWQTFVTSEPCEGRAEAERYMYRLGVLLFVCNLFLFSDLHFENIIAHGEYPMLIDSETMSTNLYSFDGYIMDQLTPWVKLVRHSVFSTLLLPTDLLEGKTDKGYMEMSGILGGLEKQKLNNSHLINTGRDDICFDDGEYEYDIGSEAGNLALLDGEPLHPAKYINHIVSGYHDGYNIVLRNKEAFFVFIKENDFSKCVFRQVMRATDLYARFLVASYHPFYLENHEKRMSVYSKLKGKSGYVNEAHEKMVASEVNQLLHDDIPFFFARFDSLALYPPYGEPIEGFFSKTLHEQLIKRIHSLSEEDRDRQESFIRYSLEERDNALGGCVCYPIPEDSVEGSNTEEQIRTLMRYLFKLRESQRLLDSETNTEYYYSISGSALDTQLAQESITLYCGGGAALLYLQLYKHYGESYKSDALRMLKLCLPKLQDEMSKESLWGLFTGYGSELYLALQAYRMLGDKTYLDTMDSICRWMLKVENPEQKTFDVVAGYAGTIIFCLQAWEKDSSLQSLYDLSVKMGEYLYKLYDNGKIIRQSGLAHGYAGPMAAFFMLAKQMNSDKYYNAAVDLLHREQDLFMPDKNGWLDTRSDMPPMDMWCYGAGGILVSRVLSIDCAKESERALLQKDIDHCVSRLMEVTHEYLPAILCHGSAGNLDILLWYASRYHDDVVYRFVKEKTEAVLKYIKKNGIPMETYKRGLNISFMLGTSGLAYYLLRYLDPDIPSVVALETL